jgi:amidohydrolase
VYRGYQVEFFGGIVLKEIIEQEIEYLHEDLCKISDFIYHNPELGKMEFKAVEKLTEMLKQQGFQVEMNICGYETAFKASYNSGKAGPTIAFLCEYDALPGIGHGCGHNLIGVMGVGAGIGLSKAVESTGGKIVVLGTPAEETHGAKVAMAEQGIFADVDVAMIVHPDGCTHASGGSLAMDAIQMEFKGRASHAASAPEKGINALDAVIQTFNGINALRQHLSSDVRIHGIITQGGLAANIVPDYAAAQFYVRAGRRKDLADVVDKVQNCAKGAAEMTGAKLTLSNYEFSYDDMNTNQLLSAVFNANLLAAGEPYIYPARSSCGSIDMGNVSYVAPSIHPYIGIDNLELVGHTTAMAAATLTETAHTALLRGAKAMAWTGYDILVNQQLLADIKEEFNKSRTQ